MTSQTACLLALIFGIVPVLTPAADAQRWQTVRLPLDFLPSGLAVGIRDHVLVWQHEGNFRIVDADGRWLAKRRLDLGDLRPRTVTPRGTIPMGGVRDVIADGDGFLVLAAVDDPEEYRVIALDDAGNERGRWQVRDVRSMLSDGRRRKVVTGSGIVELMPDAALGVEQALPAEIGRPGSVPIMLHSRSGDIVCHMANLTKLNSAPDVCRPLSGKNWQYTGDVSLFKPVICGDWLVVRAGVRQSMIRLVNLNDGKLQASGDFPSVSEIACWQDEQLVLAGRNVQILRLPDLQVRWTGAFARNPIDALVAGARVIAWVRRDESGLTLFLPYPEGLRSH